MAVAFDAKTAAWTQQPSGTSLSITNLTVGSGANRALAILLMCGSSGSGFPAGLAISRAGGESISGGTIVAVPSTSFADGNLSGSGLIYALLNPAAGNTTISVSWTGTNEVYACAISFTGVDQTNVATAFPNGATVTHATNTASPCSITITSAAGDIAIAAHGENVSTWGAIGSTTLATDDTGPNLGVASNYANGAATVTLTAAFTGSCPWSSMGCNVKAAAAAGGTPYNPWPQLGPLLAQRRRPFQGWDPLFDHRWRRRRGNSLLVRPALVAVRREVKAA